MEFEDGFEAVVAEVRPLSPSLLRVVFAGAGVEGYRGLDVGDECLTMRFPDRAADGSNAAGSDGWAWRNYSVRARNATTLTVDFVVHEGGAASTWARSARPGDGVVMTRPRSWYDPPVGTTRRLLAADLTGLPALSRIVESLGDDEAAATTIVVELLHPGDVDALPHRPGLRIETFVSPGAGSLALRCAPFVPDAAGGYVWFAGEASESRAIRKHLRGDRGYALRQTHCVGYWRRDAEAWMQRFAPRAEELLAHYEAALAEGGGWEDASEAYDIALERAGL